MIDAGRMREVITLESPTGTPGMLGQRTWVTVGTMRGWIDTPSGKELNSPQMGGSQADQVFHVRFTRAVKANMRLRIGREPARVFDVLWVKPVSEGNLRALEIYCREVMTI